MGVPCFIKTEVDHPHKIYVFAVVPRIGEIITFTWRNSEGKDDELSKSYVVEGVEHIPDGGGSYKFHASVTLKVREMAD